MRNVIHRFHLAALWIVLLIAPHFQAQPSIPILAFGLCLFGLVYLASTNVFVPGLKMIMWRGYAFFVSLILILIGLAVGGIPVPYLLFSRLGSYSMFDDGKLVIFGDMIHLTSAASCEETIAIGQILCDPWARTFNQNPDVASFLKLISLNNHIFLGVFSFVLLSFTMFLLLRKFTEESPLVWVMCLTPPMVLAIDRGNETLTLSLICLSIYFWNARPNSSLFLFPLILAGVFKVWPFAVFFLMLLIWIPKKLPRIIYFSLPVGSYVIFNITDFQKISAYTQQGSLLGGSFGLSLLHFPGIYGITVLLACISLATLMLRLIPWNILAQEGLRENKEWILALMSTFVLLNLTGVHFSYRLIILIPLAALFQGSSDARSLQVFIFTLLLTSRMSVLIVSTLSLVIIFLFLILVDFKRYFQQDLTLSKN